MARFQHERFFNEHLECVVLLTTTLKGQTPPPFKSFTLYGSEDAPFRLDLYASNDPLYNDQPTAVYERNSETGNLEQTK